MVDTPQLPLVLAVEPDHQQAAVLARVIRQQVKADLIVVDSRDAAIAALTARVPDVILLTALLSPRDEDEMVAHLRSRSGADHVQTHTIPQLAAGPAEPASLPSSGLLSKFRRKKESEPMQGCDPALFAAEVSTFLARAAEMKTHAAPALVTRASHPEASASEIEERHPEAAGDPGSSSSWSSPFEWRRSDPAPEPDAVPASGVAVGGAQDLDDAAPEQKEPLHESTDASSRADADAVMERLRAEVLEQERRLEEAAAEREQLRLEAEAAAERARLEAVAAAEREQARLEAEAAVERERLRLEAEAAAERARLEAVAAAEREQARLEAEAAVERERLRLEAQAAAERARLEAVAAAERQRARVAEEERERLAAEAAALKEQLAREAAAAIEQERRRLEAQAAAERERQQFEAEAASREARLREEADAREAHLACSAGAAEAGRAVRLQDPFADFRVDPDVLSPLLQLIPVSAWARTQAPPAPLRWVPASAVPVDPAKAEGDELQGLIKGLSVPAQVACVGYPRGCRIRRVRVPAAVEPPAEAAGPVIVSRRALEEMRAGR